LKAFGSVSCPVTSECSPWAKARLDAKVRTAIIHRSLPNTLYLFLFGPPEYQHKAEIGHIAQDL
jgi:hypothetical protein